MQDDITSNVDYSQILPIQQKRTVAFINHFVMKTVAFLNNFSQSCESQLMEFEYKLEKMEANLIILETQLASIPHLNEETPIKAIIEEADLPSTKLEEENIEKNDPQYQRFFKMVQVGVPLAAVKLKMQSEGLDPNVLE